MASWCLISGLIRRLKCGRGPPDNPLKVLASMRDGFANVASQRDLVYAPRMSYMMTRLFHVSRNDCGKRKPKGTQQKRNPLKMNKKSGLERATVHNEMTIIELSQALKKSTDHVYEVLMSVPNTDDYDHDEAVLDRATITNVVKRSGMIPEFVGRKEKKSGTESQNKDVVRQPAPDPDVLVKRPAVVTIMGHVDHGKTTLLDRLRNSNIVDREFGGITQHIGAFLVTLESGESICFLDTPGHAAFSAMRSRGAHLTDIIVLVVAADDGVMQQTLESIQLAKSTGVPLIVAINKIDKNNADVERAKNMLLEHQIMLEEFGGDVQAVPISALQGTNLLELQEAIVTQAELMSLRGDPVGLVEGSVVEARLDSKRGRLVTAVIQRGTLKRGDILVAGTAMAKVRGMFDDLNQPVQQVLPGNPVEILGFKETPSAGDEILQVASESEAKSALAWRHAQQMLRKQEEDSMVISEKREEHHKDYHAQLVARREAGFYRQRRRGLRTSEQQEESDDPQFSLILKGDVDGSVEAILDTLDTYRSKKCRLDIIHFGVGNITESDVEMASAFKGEIYAFNVEVPSKVMELAKGKGVKIRQHNVIYRLFDDLKEGINAKLPKLQEDVVIGEAKVLQVFQVTLPNKKRTFVAGCRCTHGNLSKKFGVKVLRNDETIYEGQILSLKHFKDEVDSIKKEQECGVSLDDPDIVFQPQDQIISFEVKDIDQEIDWDPGF
ncbi:translation initiation factor IF-2, mitochondrial [Aplysia californica]|uniref:Translation initiation factor IF-2, mitochondrial n=1 Tax=Aplysia californica TaxID=6500 RepID=A0ABM0K9T1_APLCA|nr:translation initiation factor IF-2, mitochondrial [Aplysia californica]